jgi:HAD superfamily hydrolase (TIGR01509 family)
MVDIALFELEGVIFDTKELRRVALRSALAEHGIDCALDGDVVDGLSPRSAAIAALSLAHTEHDDVLLDLIALQAGRSFSSALATTGVAVREGAREFVERAAARARVAFVTRALRSDTDTMLRLAGLESVATVTVCLDDVLEGKPLPDGYHLALDRLNRQRPALRASAMALEDGAAGIRAARTAGVRCVAVGPLAPHLAIEADAYVASLDGQSLPSLDLLSKPGREQVQ